MTRRTAIKTAAAGFASVPQPQAASPAQDSWGWESAMGQPWTRPRKLDTFRGLHPRLLLTGARIADLKRKISGTHREIWEAVKENADDYQGRMPPSNFKSQSQMRTAGRGIPWQALAYLITGNRLYLEGAKKWMLKVCEFPHWENDVSLSGGECLFGVAAGYDWLYAELEDREKKFVREKLIQQAEAMRKGPPVHHDKWLANHNHVEHLGLAAAGFALYDEVPQAIEWIRQADLVFRMMLQAASRDGSSTEGHQYWAYSIEAILRYAELARDLLGEDFYRHQWLKNAPAFIIHSTLPGFDSKNHVMSFGDSHRTYSSHGPAHILYRLAAEHKNPHAQWLAREMQHRGVGRRDYCTWTSLLWHDEQVSSTPIAQLPAFWHCEDIGWITSRSSWDDQAVMVGFKCGPMHGHKVQPYYESQVEKPWPQYHEVGGGHGHPDVNSLQIYAYGKWLAIDPGYERPKWTRNHNTILVNGLGQLGEGQTWFDRKAVIAARASSAVIKAEHTPAYDYLIGDAKNIYPKSAGLKRFHRHVLYARPDWIVTADDLEADAAALFEWLLHTESGIDKQSESCFLIQNGEVFMELHFLLPKKIDTQVDGGSLRASPERTTRALIVAAMHPRKARDVAGTAELRSRSGPRLELVVGSGKGKTAIQIDLEKQTVALAGID